MTKTLDDSLQVYTNLFQKLISRYENIEPLIQKLLRREDQMRLIWKKEGLEPLPLIRQATSASREQ